MMEIKLDTTTATVLLAEITMRFIDKLESLKAKPNDADVDALKVIYRSMYNTLTELTKHMDSYHESQRSMIEEVCELMAVSIPDLVKLGVLEFDDIPIKLKGGSRVTH